MHSSKKDNNLSKNHWNHHEHTLDDMNLKTSENYNDNINKYLGLYFTWLYTGVVFIVGLIEAFLLYFLLKIVKINISPLFVIVSVILFSIYQSSFWNTIHPDIHNIKENLNWNEGIPGWDGWKTIYSSVYINNNTNIYDWFINNHKLHHLRKGDRKGNYNVTLPGADWVLGKLYISQ